jgi:hypothetical protein
LGKGFYNSAGVGIFSELISTFAEEKNTTRHNAEINSAKYAVLHDD